MEIDVIELMINKLRTIRNTIKKKNKLSEKSLKMNFETNTIKQLDKVNSDLNWQCMHLDKEITDFSRIFEDSFLNVSTQDKEYNPTGFHSFIHSKPNNGKQKIATTAEEILEKNLCNYDTTCYTPEDSRLKQAYLNAISEALDIHP